MSKGMHAHNLYALGKAKAERDSRNIRFAAIEAHKTAPPPSYDFDATHKGIPLPMFANDQLGCCVIAGRAHQTLRFELLEQRAVIAITDVDVRGEYFKESGGRDSGLVVLQSLKAWRTAGWIVGKRTYRIAAFAEVNRASQEEVRAAICTNLGIGIGLSLPKSAQAQTSAGRPWDVVSGPSGAVNSWGGHYVYVRGYNRTGPLCVTWGKAQRMTWAFFAKYCDEAYLIVDALDRKGIDGGALRRELAQVT